MSADKPRVWDLPVRLCHVGFIILIPVLWWTGEEGEMGWHKRAGIVLLGLLVFRLLWGFVGSSTARFAQFVRGPGAVLAYLRGERSGAPGHNPLGGWSVLALLGAMFAQVGSGLFAGNEFDGATGPLNGLVLMMTADALTDWHEIGYNVIWGLIGLHVAAVLFYLFVKREQLIVPMITGRDDSVTGTGIARVPAWRFVLAAVLSAGLAVWVQAGAPPLEVRAPLF